MRRLLTVLLVLGVLALAVDRAAAYVVAGQVESRLKTHGFRGVDVELHGFPFLTQLVAHRLDDVDMRSDSATNEGSTVRRVSVTAQGVETRAASRVFVRSVGARATVPYSEVQRRLDVKGLTVRSGADGQVQLRRPVRVLGQRLTVLATGRVTAAGTAIRIRPTTVTLASGGALAASVAARVEDLVTVRYVLRGLPDGVRIDDVVAGADGFVVTASGRSLHLHQ